MPTALYAAWPVLLADVFVIGLAVAGGYRPAWAAGRIPPVEALKQAIG